MFSMASINMFGVLTLWGHYYVPNIVSEELMSQFPPNLSYTNQLLLKTIIGITKDLLLPYFTFTISKKLKKNLSKLLNIGCMD